MRWLVVLLVVASPAHARLVIDEPGMYYACPKGKTWADVQTCLATQGRPAVLHQAAGAKLVRLDQLENGVWVDGGVYLYVEYKQAWKIAGSFFGRGTDYELSRLAPLTLGKATGYRIEVAQASPLYVQLDGLTAQRATRRAYHSLFCSAQGNTCVTAVRSCEVLVNGAAYWTFHGTVEVHGNEISITGPRTHAGPFCAQAERVYLGWPNP